MFVKVYRYKIKNSDFRAWKKVNDKTRAVFRRYGVLSKRLINKDKQFVHIIEMDQFPSNKAFLTIDKQTKKDDEVSRLYNTFMGLVHRKHVLEEDFNLI